MNRSDLPSLTMFNGTGGNFEFIGTVALQSKIDEFLLPDIPNLELNQTRFGCSAFQYVYTIHATSIFIFYLLFRR